MTLDSKLERLEHVGQHAFQRMYKLYNCIVLLSFSPPTTLLFSCTDLGMFLSLAARTASRRNRMGATKRGATVRPCWPYCKRSKMSLKPRACQLCRCKHVSTIWIRRARFAHLYFTYLAGDVFMASIFNYYNISKRFFIIFFYSMRYQSITTVS